MNSSQRGDDFAPGSSLSEVLTNIGTMAAPENTQPPSRVRNRVLATTTASRGGAVGYMRLGRMVAVATVASIAAAGVGLTLAHVVGKSGREGTATTEAAALLSRAADAVLRLPSDPVPTSGFVFREERVGFPDGSTTQVRSWISVDGSVDGVVKSDHGPSGVTSNIPVPGCVNGKGPSWAVTGQTLDHQKLQPCTPQPGIVADLPVTAESMLSHLKKMSGTDSDSHSAFANVIVLLDRGYLTPPERAALFDAASMIDGVGTRPDVRDAAGRHGTAISWLAGERAHEEVIFDSSTFELLGWQVTTSTGAILRSAALLSTAFVPTLGELP